MKIVEYHHHRKEVNPHLFGIVAFFALVIMLMALDILPMLFTDLAFWPFFWLAVSNIIAIAIGLLFYFEMITFPQQIDYKMIPTSIDCGQKPSDNSDISINKRWAA